MVGGIGFGRNSALLSPLGFDVPQVNKEPAWAELGQVVVVSGVEGWGWGLRGVLGLSSVVSQIPLVKSCITPAFTSFCRNSFSLAML